ncbi:AlpA family transcriptional regulator [Roseomonas sp. NAR14]|uniref:AlpA family transcriptional regulator n=1 Tax=Roseomonas acroporae TaxID=2937791 RepID=A0A9X1YC16_9PROT|nr:AlpA family transcriptional regulator [Roseomonas acroporae]MCK8787689.1 AlpA family transcriptional regulator [Roseomonas acroporae]
MSERLLRLEDVTDRVGLGRSTIYRRMGAGTFPRPMQLGGGVVRWRETDIETWLSALTAERRPEPTAGARPAA